jgi:hypothetical protein
MRSLTTLTAAVLAALLLAVPASAKTNVAVGLGDQNPQMFASPDFQALGIKKVRYFIRWNAIRDPQQLAAADAFVAAAKASGDRVLLHISTDDFTDKKAKLPSVGEFRSTVGALVRRYKAQGVKEWGVWNEANHKTQPTWDNPRRAAQFYVEMRKLCKGCTLVALDVLDQAGVERYIQRWYAALPRSLRSAANNIGIHNYSDTNRQRSRGTASIIKTVKRANSRADFWLTETGGVVNFGRSFPCNETRAANRLKYMFGLAKKFRRDVERLYAYNWTGADCDGFDAGLTRRDGSLRPGYAVFKAQAKSFAR